LGCKEFPIPSIDQQPDSRRAILLSLKREGPSTISQLAEWLGLTGEAVRQQLLQLQREGWTESRLTVAKERARTGRPATRYHLSEAGDHLFPKSYDFLNVAMIDAMIAEFGPDAAKRVLRRVCDERVGAASASIRDLPLHQRVEALRGLYFESDPFMDSEEVEGGYRLIERNCPFLTTAMSRPALCSVSVNALTRLLGVRVRREETFQGGFGRCVFHVYADDPIDPETWEFKLESEMR